MVYSLIRGPGTVGIDANVSIEELVNVTLEAFEYYGVYAISRYYIYQLPTLITIPTTTLSSIDCDDIYNSNNNSDLLLHNITNQM